jgi:hypothetical protein
VSKRKHRTAHKDMKKSLSGRAGIYIFSVRNLAERFWPRMKRVGAF